MSTSLIQKIFNHKSFHVNGKIKKKKVEINHLGIWYWSAHNNLHHMYGAGNIKVTPCATPDFLTIQIFFSFFPPKQDQLKKCKNNFLTRQCINTMRHVCWLGEKLSKSDTDQT